jgi:NAD(P)-dependent dehydrogenase (short-subunit alcohol dehydrogenase family)
MIPRFLKRESKSAIIDLSSVRHMTPGGNVPVYSATKSYNYTFSRSMAEAYGDKIDVMTVTPGPLATKTNSGKYLFCIQPEQHAKCVVD